MAGPWEKYAAPADGPWAKYAEPAKEEKPSRGMAGVAGDLLAGAVRGAGSIGATLLAPVDVASDLFAGKGLTLESNRQRRKDMDAGLRELGADTESLAYKGGKLGGEIAGTLGVGGALAPAVAKVAPSLAPAVASAGFRGGSLGARTAGGAITGAASAGLVNPEDAATGAMIGGALPGVMRVAGAAGQKVGAVVRGPEQTPDAVAAIKAAREAGYVIPPTQAKPSLANRVLEGMSGKITTAQNASAMNQTVTNAKAATSLGLAPDTKITPDVLKSVRDQAGQAYEALGGVGTIAPGAGYEAALNKIAEPFKRAQASFPGAKPSPVLDLVESLKTPAFDAGAAIEKIKQLRTAADDAFRTGNTDVARASKQAAQALEDAIEDHLKTSGATDMLKQFREARQLIAKTYSVEKALNPASGAVDARQLAGQLKRGKPLSGDLKDAAEFAARFPKAAQTVEQMGSLPQTSPLDWSLGAITSAASGSPLGLLTTMTRPIARGAALSPMVQNRLAQQPGSVPLSSFAKGAGQLGYRAAPLTSGDQ